MHTLKKYNGYTIKELMKITGKSYSYCYGFVYRNPNRTLERLKRSAENKHLITYKGMNLKEIMEKTGRNYWTCYRFVNNNKKRTLQDIRDYKGARGNHYKLYNGLTIKEIAEKTGKTVKSCRSIIKRYPKTWTLDYIKSTSRKKSNIKWSKDGMLLKEYCKKNNISYSTTLKKIHNGKFKVDRVKREFLYNN